MNLESQVTNLELSKKLHDLEIKKNSQFYWFKSNLTNRLPAIYHNHWIAPSCFNLKNFDKYICINAFTSGELGILLPKYIKQRNFEYYYTQIPSKHCEKWIITYRASFTSWEGEDQEDENEANARAKMLIYLTEQGLIKIEDKND